MLELKYHTLDHKKTVSLVDPSKINSIGTSLHQDLVSFFIDLEGSRVITGYADLFTWRAFIDEMPFTITVPDYSEFPQVFDESRAQA
jgi:hypothetical protein